MEISPNSESKPLVRRRLIQSTLFPHKSPDNVICVDEDIEPDVDHEDDEDDYRASQIQVKKNNKRKPKVTSQSRASRELSVNGHEIGGKNNDGEDSVAAVMDFFAKVSEKRQQRRQKKEQLPINSPDKTEQCCSPPDAITNLKSPRKPRKRANSTPKKGQDSVTPEKGKRKRNSTPIKNGINGAFNEDKMLASPPKVIPDLRLEAKMTAEENSRIFAGKQVHPFFSSWKTSKKNTGTENNKPCHIQKTESNNDFIPLHIFEKTQDETFSVDWRNWTLSENISTTANPDPEDACLQLTSQKTVNCLQFDSFLHTSQNSQVVHENGKIDGFSENSEFVVSSDSQLLSERITSNYHDCSNHPVNSLWTTKYQPEKAIEICGNCESVKFLNEWLHLWHEKGSRNGYKCSTDNENRVNQDVDFDLNYSPSDCDSDFENTDEDNSLKNVLLVTGPVGSGKSAAIYACAKEQGFQVIEVNTSDWRNGALVKQKFGEAVESHWLQCSMPNIEIPDNKSQPKSTDDVIELIHLSDDEDSKNVGEPTMKPIIGSQNGIKTLILFEDVDASLYEDRGFIATIQQLAETAKRPMILTSNSHDPDLPNNLDRIEVSFRIPSSEELLSLANMVCKTEKAEIEPCLVERFIDYCQGDIRKTIMLLQFWCQGQSQRKDNEIQNIYAPLIFDTNAGHHILPQIIPCGFTSKLSEMIDNEITKSTALTETEPNFMEIIDEEDEIETQDIDAKKDEMLRMHCSDNDENDFCITRRTLQKKINPVMFSDSEPCWNEQLFDITDDINVEIEISGQTKKSRRKYNAVMDSDSDSDSDSEEDCFNFNDVSCVPESSYVPETVIENGTSCEHFDDEICSPKTTCTVQEGEKTVIMVEDSGLDTGIYTGPVDCEEIGDSHVEPVEDVSREYQMMDECSRIDFGKKADVARFTDIVQDTWQKLRDCSKELNQYVSVEENDTLEALRICYGMTDLISEADLLLSDCHVLTCDYLKPSMVSSKKSQSYSWHDDQLQMASTFGQHGFCLYAKRSFGSGTNDRVDLAWEMMSASTNTISLGKLINRNKKTVRNLGNKKLQNGVSSKSMLDSPLCNTIQSIVPLRSQLSLKGYLFHEYLSSLVQISRSESSRLSESNNQSNQRRKRVARNYLSNGALSLSSEDISLLDQYSFYQKQKLKDENVV